MDTTQIKTSQVDADSIQEVFATLATAWNTADADLFSSVFTPDADYVTFNGQHLKGREAIAQVHMDLWRKFLKGSRLVSAEPMQIRFVHETLAIAHGKGAVLMRWQKKPSENRLSINTNVLIKQNGQWYITAFHNCRIQKMPWFIRLFAK
ncbi:SgcJ/EcaC family oxidoreductase [Rhodocytophaga rosea]|uniref:SgcJ/EcaC family oxidoreductase n=1 Tax=Rhodocytophaga rosea TaxID=2704465 RepID=A0A6C0GHR8_9BACT|nr:SgcJ/EcaC family oxidoreductase [Rhodocytophaga rosea]QHT67232.1 SgcJ/EcaC family oxidoreductase [Rhodocytophaga rosea]